MSRVSVVGLGAVGARAARQLASTEGIDHLTLCDPDQSRLTMVREALEADLDVVASSGEVLEGVDAVVLAQPAGSHAEMARRVIRAGVDVVSVSDDMDEVKALLDLDPLATELGRTIAVGAGFAPGLTCLLAAHAVQLFDEVTEIHVAKSGTGGPACARQHHRALSGVARDWRDGGWVERPGGTGRELCWFPSPVDGKDCYRASLPDAMLLSRTFAGLERVTARMAANRRDRLTMHLPMLAPPHADGGPGGVRVEIRGLQGARRATHVLGSMDRPGLAAGTVAAVTTKALLSGSASRVGAGGLSELFVPLPLLHELASRGVRGAVFEGLSSA